MTSKRSITPASIVGIAEPIVILRGQKILIDADLDILYGVSTARLNQQVRRNLDRFPRDFMFQVTAKEYAAGAARCRLPIPNTVRFKLRMFYAHNAP